MKKAFLIALILIVGKTYGQTFDELTSAAIKAEKEKNYTQAIDLLEKALKLDNGNYFIYNKLGLMYYHLNNLDRSIEYCNLTLKKIPNDSTALYQRGFCYMDKNEFQKAINDFTLSFEKTNKKNSNASFNIAKSYGELGNFDKAIEYYNLTLILEPNDKYSFYELGRSYASLQKPDKVNALKFYNKAIEQDKNYYDPYFNRGLLYATQYKDIKKGHQDLEKSIEIRPKNKLSYLYNGMLYRDEEDFGKAKDMFTKVIELYPDYANAYFQRAVTWYKIGILNMVCKDLDKAESFGSTDATEYKKQVCK